MEEEPNIDTPPIHLISLLGPENYQSWRREMEAVLDKSAVIRIIQEANNPADWTPPLTAAQSRRIDLSHWRAVAQEYHFTPLEKASCVWPVYVHNEAGAVTALNIPLQFGERETKPVSSMNGDDARQFYFKDCAIYVNVRFQDPFEGMKIFEKIYGTWWPGRTKGSEVGEGGVTRGSFFSVFLYFSPRNVLMREIVMVHSELARKLKELEPEVPVPKVMCFDPRYGKEREKGLYRVMDSFSEVFLVIDRTEWQREGVLCVFRDEKVVREYPLDGREEEIDDGMMGERVAEWRRPRVFRISLERAVEIVGGRDEERRARGKRREWNDMKECFLGGKNGENEDPSV